MKVLVSSKGFQITPQLRDEVTSFVTEAFLRWELQIKQVRAFLADENGPKKGNDRKIQLIVDLRRRPLAVARASGTQWKNVLHHATQRAIYTISRQVERRRSHSGRPSMAGADTP